MSRVLYREWHEVDGRVVTLAATSGAGVVAREDDGARGRASSGLTSVLRQVFLPEGYPTSVSSDYLSYQVWDTVQAFASSISGSLATKVNEVEGKANCLYY